MSQFIIMIRAPEDPDRVRRTHAEAPDADRTPHKTIKGWSVDRIKKTLLDHLSDGRPRTLHAISVQLWRMSASTTGGSKVEEALWQLVEEYEVGYTLSAPIRFVVNPYVRYDRATGRWVAKESKHG